MKLLLLLAAASTGQFDLECSGELNAKYSSGLHKEPWSAHFRLDLGDKKWCRGDCLERHSFVDVQENVLILNQAKNADPATEESIDRVEGTYRDDAMWADGRWSFTTAKCEKRPFSGFPKPTTKF